MLLLDEPADFPGFITMPLANQPLNYGNSSAR